MSSGVEATPGREERPIQGDTMSFMISQRVNLKDIVQGEGPDLTHIEVTHPETSRRSQERSEGRGG